MLQSSTDILLFETFLLHLVIFSLFSGPVLEFKYEYGGGCSDIEFD